MKQSLENLGVFASFEDVYLFFKRYDTDKDGRLRFSEFCNAIVSLDPYHASMVNRRNSNGIMNLYLYQRGECFVPSTRMFLRELFETHFSVEKQAEYLRNRLARDSLFDISVAYKACDLNEDGIITRNEIQRLLEERGIYVSQLDMSALMEKLDKDKDGMITYSEFAQEMRPKNLTF